MENRHCSTREPSRLPLSEVAEIASELNSRIADLAHELLGPPNRGLTTARQLRYGSKGSLAIEVEGPAYGRWYDHESEAGGDALELLRREKDLGIGAACEWARRWLGRETQKTNQGSRRKSAPKDDERKPSPTQAIEKILKETGPIAGTPGERYLGRRGIDVVSDSIGFRPRAWGDHGAIVARATDDTGAVLAVQQIYVTEDGSKAPVPVRKRTNKAVNGWSERAAVRLPGAAPLVICEGVETALSVWQATGQEVWACLGISNIGRAPISNRATVIIAGDGDAPGSKADDQLRRAAEALVQKDAVVSIATPPEGQDFNDVLMRAGPEAARALIENAQPLRQDTDGSRRTLSLGSDVEIARLVRNDLFSVGNAPIFAEGVFWRFAGTHWARVPDHELRIRVHAYDGATIESAQAKPARVRLGKGRIDSILNECAALCAAPEFFATAATGINCASGFIRFDPGGTPHVEPHNPEHRCRHILPGKWSPEATGTPPENSLFNRFLEGVFRGDGDSEDKKKLLADICGSVALGYATKFRQPRAVILFGQTAQNGKSQFLDVARGLLPSSAIGSVPASRMGDERHIVGLVGKLLNAADELSAGAIASDAFKAVVTGEPVEGGRCTRAGSSFARSRRISSRPTSCPPFEAGSIVACSAGCW